MGSQKLRVSCTGTRVEATPEYAIGDTTKILIF